GHLHYLLSLSPEPYAFGHGISYAAVPPARRAYAPEGRGMRVTQQMGVFRQSQSHGFTTRPDLIQVVQTLILLVWPFLTVLTF
ncbi:MAG: hypothetical protein PVH82_19745, partial [Desulfobacteraceae bacterium]